MVWWLIQHLVITSLLAVGVGCVCLFFRNRPYLCHGLWLIVICKFLLPPVVFWPASFRPTATHLDPGTDDNSTSGVLSPSLAWEFILPTDPIGEVDPTAGNAQVTEAGRQSQPVQEIRNRETAFDLKTVTPLLLSIWFGGSLFACVAYLWRILKVRQLVQATGSPPARLSEMTQAVADEMHVTPPKIVVADFIRSPFVWCVGKTLIVWPRKWSLTGDEFQNRAMLVHELAHIRRRDHWVTWIELLATIVWWWNPFLRWAKRRLNETAEMSCDLWVTKLMPARSRSYSELLIQISRIPPSVAAPSLVPVAAKNRREFKRRLKMIMSRKPRTSAGYAIPLLVAVACLALPSFQYAAATIETTQAEKPADPVARQLPSNPAPAAITAQKTDAPKTGTADSKLSVDVLSEIVKQVEKVHVEDVDRQQLIKAAIEAVIQKLDDETMYLNVDQWKMMQSSLQSQFVGIGAILRLDDEKNVVITGTLPKSPAQRAGIKPEDQIVSIGDLKIADVEVEKRLAETVKNVRGKPDTSVKLGLLREGEKVEVSVPRGVVELATVRGYRQDKNGTQDFMYDQERKIGYIQILNFAKNTSRDVAAAAKSLKDNGARGLILDLRFNGGGTLVEAVRTANLFLDKGKIVSVKKKDASENVDYSADPKKKQIDLPVSVLVNSRTASAAEILAACLQDHERATIVGQRTFGMGMVKSITSLSNGGALRLPVALLLRPNGDEIHRGRAATEKGTWGVKPTVKVDLTKEEEERYSQRLHPYARRDASDKIQDRQLDKAVEALNLKS